DGGIATGGANIPDGRRPVGMAGRPPAGIPAIEGRSDGAGAGAGVANGALTRGTIGAVGTGGAGAGSGCLSGAGTADSGGWVPLLETGKTAAHTVQRADTPVAGTLAGSTR
ncbi:MAG: hypothetical protein WBC97_07585, partial [Gemmatimonadales bacterium]